MSDQTKLSMSELESYHNQGSGLKAGKYLRFYCPIHGGDHQRSLSLDPETGHFRCFSCAAWGYIEEQKQEWVAKHKDEWISQKHAKQVFRKPDPPREPEVRPELEKVLHDLQRSLPGSLGEKYLEIRKIPFSIAQEYGAGYAAFGKWPHLKDGRFVRQWKPGRIVFPHTNPQGQIVNLYGRAIELGVPVPKEYKHDHLPGMKGVFNAKALLADTSFISEGCFNALSLITAGYKNACAIFGVDGLRWEWIKSKRIVFCLDQDKAGENWRKLAWEGILRGKEIFWLPPKVYGNHKDLNEVWMATGKLDIGNWKRNPPLQEEVCENWRKEIKNWPDDLQEAWQERLAIMYFDGGLEKDKAEKFAYEEIKKNRK